VSWIVRGFWHFKTAALPWVLITAGFMALSILAGLVPFVGGIIASILSPILIGGVMYGAQEQDRGRTLRVEHLFAGFSQNFSQLALVGLLYTAGAMLLAILVGVIVGAALTPVISGAEPEILSSQDRELILEQIGPSLAVSLLLASLLYVPLIMAVVFAPALVILDGVQASEALKQSFSACVRNIRPFLLFGLIAVGLLFLGALPFGLGLLVVWPTLAAATYVGYWDIFRPDMHGPVVEGESQG
jgi:hypothetical protein